MKLRLSMTAGVVLFVLASFSQVVDAQGRRWIYLGEANVDGMADHDRIRVGRDDGRFSALQIRVERAPIDFHRIVVHYGNGGDEEVQVRNRIRAGGRTRNINIRGNDRVIESVEIWYAKGSWSSRKPKLRLYGYGR